MNLVPLPGPDRRQVQAALDEFLGSPEILRSPQLAKFLTYIVSTKLRGESANIKAYSIAVDVFGRPASFDPQTDPIVRVQAGRLRKLLDDFYESGLAQSGVRIRLPVGGYVPQFEPLPEPEGSRRDVNGIAAGSGPAASGALPRPIWSTPQFWRPLVLFGVLAGGVGLATYLTPRPGTAPDAMALPERPVVVIGDFDNLSGLSSVDAVLAALGPRLASDLSRFEEIEVGDPAEAGEGAVNVLTGVALRQGNGFVVSATLSDGPEGEAIWTATIARPEPGADVEALTAGISRAIVREIAPFRGPLHRRGRNWLSDQVGALPAVNVYACLLRYHYARDRQQSADIAAAIDCFDRLPQGEADLPSALAARAWLDAIAALSDASPDEEVADRYAEAERSARRAVELAPDSSFAHEQLGFINDWLQQFEAAKESFAAAVGLNPLNTDARAAYATALGRAGEWALASQQARLALADAAYPAPWYHYPMAAVALRQRRFEEAMDHGTRLAEIGNGELGSLFVLAAAGHAGLLETVPEYLSRVKTMEHLRRLGIMPWLRMRVLDQGLLALLEEGLLLAGVPQNALTRPF